MSSFPQVESFDAIQAKKVIYAHFMEKGDVISPDRGWNVYYGAWTPVSPPMFDRKTYRRTTSERQALIVKLTVVPVDWEASTEPRWTEQSEFQDSASPNRKVLAAYGKLVLTDGSEYWVGSQITEEIKDLCEKLAQTHIRPVQEENLVTKYFGV